MFWNNICANIIKYLNINSMRILQNLGLAICLFITSQSFYGQQTSSNSSSQEILLNKEKEHAKRTLENQKELQKRQDLLKQDQDKAKKRQKKIESAQKKTERTQKDIKKTEDKIQKIQNELSLNKIPENKIQQNKIKSKEYELEVLKLQSKLSIQQQDLTKLLDSK